MEDIYVGGNNPRRDDDDKKPRKSEDIYITPRKPKNDIYIDRNRQSQYPPQQQPRRPQYPPRQQQPQNNRYSAPQPPRQPQYSRPPQAPQQPPQQPKKKKKNKFLRAAIAMLMVVVILITSGIGFVYYTFSSVNYTKTGHSDNVFLDRDELMHSSSVKNILLIGVDRRNADDSSRSDTMLMVSINTSTRKIKLTSFMRDSYVYIPEKKKSAKLNAACTWGGAQMVMDTIEYNFNVRIDHYMLVDFTMFEDIIDGLGGITVEITEKEAKYMRDAVHLKNIQAGEAVHLNGKEALWYCRIRKLDSDFMRTERQRKVMTSIINKCKSTNPVELYKILTDVIGQVETDMSPADLTTLALNALVRYLSYDIEQGSVPAEGTWKSKTISGQSVLSLDLGANIEFLKEFIYEE